MFATTLTSPAVAGATFVLSGIYAAVVVRRHQRQRARLERLPGGPEPFTSEPPDLPQSTPTDVVTLSHDWPHATVADEGERARRERCLTQLKECTERLSPGLLNRPLDERDARRYALILDAYVDRAMDILASTSEVGGTE